MNNITVKINLDKLWPSEVIALHRQGVITLNEIIASRRHLTAFGDELANYVWQAGKLAGDKTELNNY